MGCCGGVIRDNSGSNIQVIGGIAKIERELEGYRSHNRAIDAIKSHKIAIDVAMKTGDMSQVRQVNEEYFSRELASMESYERSDHG
jgi:hypothetical protein